MEITKTIQPGELGSKQLYQHYGEQLVCVRYRIDRLLQKRYTTVELIVAEKPYISQPSSSTVWVKLNYDERELRQQLNTAGATWLAKYMVWEMPEELARKMRLSKRIVKKVAALHV
jgi:hypothetical protein